MALLATYCSWAIHHARPPGLDRPVAAWALVVAAVAGVGGWAGEPAGVRMLAIIGTLLYAMKAVVAVEARAQGSRALPAGAGSASPPCGRACGRAPSPGRRDASAGPGRLVVLGLARMARAWPWWAWRGWPGSAPVRDAGHGVPPAGAEPDGPLRRLQRPGRGVAAGGRRLHAPVPSPRLRSTGLGEFWGRRWNLAFSEMTALAIYRPLAAPGRAAPALVASFLGSGLLHELAISVPVRAGFGLPLVYFALHGA